MFSCPFDLQLDEGNRNMAAAAHMVDLSPLPGMAPSQRQGGTAVQHRGMIEKARGGWIILWGVDVFCKGPNLYSLKTLRFLVVFNGAGVGTTYS